MDRFIKEHPQCDAKRRHAGNLWGPNRFVSKIGAGFLCVPLGFPFNPQLQKRSAPNCFLKRTAEGTLSKCPAFAPLCKSLIPYTRRNIQASGRNVVPLVDSSAPSPKKKPLEIQIKGSLRVLAEKPKEAKRGRVMFLLNENQGPGGSVLAIAWVVFW